MGKDIKIILIGILTVVLLTASIICCCVGEFYFYIGLTILCITGVCALVYFALLLADYISKSKLSETNKDFKISLNVFKWLGLWWAYIPYKLYKHFKK